MLITTQDDADSTRLQIVGKYVFGFGERLRTPKAAYLFFFSSRLCTYIPPTLR